MVEAKIALSRLSGFFGTTKTDNSISNIIENTRSSSFIWGIGAAINLKRISVRIEWEDIVLKGEGNNLSSIMFSAALTLGQRRGASDK